jgi:hypothetical protein
MIAALGQAETASALRSIRNIAEWRPVSSRRKPVSLFSTAKLRFERIANETANLIREDQALYELRPARKRLE